MKDNIAKIRLICSKAHEAFKHKNRLLIAVPNFQAAQYVDTLLWKEPSNSFMPHVVADTSTAEWIAITMQEHVNVNQAPRLLNLCPAPPAFFMQFAEVYELFDETQPEKAALSQKRLDHYKSMNLPLNQV